LDINVAAMALLAPWRQEQPAMNEQVKNDVKAQKPSKVVSVTRAGSRCQLTDVILRERFGLSDLANAKTEAMQDFYRDVHNDRRSPVRAISARQWEELDRSLQRPEVPSGREGALARLNSPVWERFIQFG
jgi:hypothetical protein